MNIKLPLLAAILLAAMVTSAQVAQPTSNDNYIVFSGFPTDCKPNSLVWDYLPGEKNWIVQINKEDIISSIVGTNHRFEFEYQKLYGAKLNYQVQTILHYQNNKLAHKIAYTFTKQLNPLDVNNNYPQTLSEESYYGLDTTTNTLILKAQVLHTATTDETFNTSMLYKNGVLIKKVTYGRFRNFDKKEFSIINYTTKAETVDYIVNKNRKKYGYLLHTSAAYYPLYFLIHYNNLFTDNYEPELTLQSYSIDFISSFTKANSNEPPAKVWDIESKRSCGYRYPTMLKETSSAGINQLFINYNCDRDCAVKITIPPPPVEKPKDIPGKGDIKIDTTVKNNLPNYYTNCLFNDDFSFNNGWQYGAVTVNKLAITRSKLLGTNIPGAYRDVSLKKQLPTQINNSYEVKFTLKVTDFGTSGGSYLPIVLTENNSPACNPDNETGIQTMQNAYGVLCMNYLNLAPTNKLWVEPFIKNGGTLQASQDNLKIYIEKNVTYQIILQQNKNIGYLIVLNESNNLIGKVQYNITQGVGGYNYVQSANTVQASEFRLMSAEVDNLCISNYKPLYDKITEPPITPTITQSATGYVRLIAFEDVNYNNTKDENELVVKNYSATLRNLSTGKVTNETMLSFKKRIDKLPIGDYQIYAQYYKTFEGKDGKKMSLLRRSANFNFSIIANKETVQSIYFLPLTVAEEAALIKIGVFDK